VISSPHPSLDGTIGYFAADGSGLSDRADAGENQSVPFHYLFLKKRQIPYRAGAGTKVQQEEQGASSRLGGDCMHLRCACQSIRNLLLHEKK
jgi:hypothetical protein